MSKVPCANYNDQAAIDATLKAANDRLIRIDEASGMVNPPPMYDLGRMVCAECAVAGNPDSAKDMFDEFAGGDSHFRRVCFREPVGEPA